MLSAWFEDGRASLVERPAPRPQPGQALLKVRLAGICNTDLELLAGYYGFVGVPGHEFVAVVQEAPGHDYLEGLRVVADINVGCGQCPRCRLGDPRHCPQRRVIGIKHWDGALAQYLLAPVSSLHGVPDGLPSPAAVFAEPLAAALEVGRQVPLDPEMRVAVLGDGKLGLLAALGLRHQVPGLLLMGHHPAKLAIAQAQGVATLLVERGGIWPPPGQGPFDLVVEATGHPQGPALALDLLRPQGTLVLKTTSHLPTNINLARVVVDEIAILGSRCGDLALALDYLAQGRLDVRPLIAQTYPFAELTTALEHARRPGALKILLRFP
ncbi:MAG: alcohol dehydrogenase catalytic domain-containing protein [Desulfarculus sp.]|nr:alcohol dehydrogenase catalytic domain-containing protein [Desulfarculus sp.]